MQIFWLLFFPLYLSPFSTLCSAAQPNLNTGGDPTASPGSCCTEPYQTVLLLLAEASPRLSAAGPGSGGHQAPPHSFRTPRCPVRGSSTLHCSCAQCLTGRVLQSLSCHKAASRASPRWDNHSSANRS